MQVLQINSTFYQVNLSQKNQGAGISQATKLLLNDLSNYFETLNMENEKVQKWL